MFKRCLFCATALIMVLLSAACTREAPPTPEASVIVQDIMAGSDDASDEPGMTPPPDSISLAEQQAEALAEEKEYLQAEIDALSQKLADLQWLRDSYIAQNPADLQAKLTECDALIAAVNTQLQGLQSRLARHENDSNASGENEPETPSDIIPEETVTPDDSAPSPEESIPAS